MWYNRNMEKGGRMGTRLSEYRFIWLLVMAATVGFIWQQSTLAPADPAATSDAVGEVIVPIVGGVESPVGSFVDRFLRKIAHFTEFAVLGLESEAYLAHRHTPVLTLLQFAFGLLIAGADELLQLFTGRGSAIADVGIDFAGFALAAVALRLLLYAVALFRKKRKGGTRAVEKNA